MSVAVELVVVSGRSGSGKSVALHALEDLGFYCIDNLPVMLLGELIAIAKKQYPRLAVSLDIRNFPTDDHDSLEKLYERIRSDQEVSSKIVFLDADDQVLIKRYAFTRRVHPLSQGNISLDEAIIKERLLLNKIASIANLKMDTTEMTVHELASAINSAIYGKSRKLVVIFESFGFKNGIVKDADFVFDARFLPNPYWKKELREHCGLDDCIKEFFAGYPEVQAYIAQLDNLLMSCLPMLNSSNRSYLTVAVGCTGGLHRSVFIAQSLADMFKARGIDTVIRHRALTKLNSAKA